MLLFCSAMVSIKELAAALSASMRLVESLSPMSLSIDPEASSTITISSGLVTSDVVSEVEDIVESVVTKSDFSSCAGSTVLSVQIRPT